MRQASRDPPPNVQSLAHAKLLSQLAHAHAYTHATHKYKEQGAYDQAGRCRHLSPSSALISPSLSRTHAHISPFSGTHMHARTRTVTRPRSPCVSPSLAATLPHKRGAGQRVTLIDGYRSEATLSLTVPLSRSFPLTHSRAPSTHSHPPSPPPLSTPLASRMNSGAPTAGGRGDIGRRL